MAEVRFIGSTAHIVPWLGRTVQPDEVVTVPDDQFDAYVCQPALWQPVAEPAPDAEPAPLMKPAPRRRGGKSGD
ncbi:hypothetical protein [Streptomyces sp. NBRC 109706]|uniref:hypothetical protein n=1 Tax=Streptomyces sp. NBRC 109706 TaxID=1550035 RepID=UPI0007829467|nr:hypothetical protein [Streptomyces sp. NBRC 109706]